MLQGWKTRLFALAVAALGVLEVIDPGLLKAVVPVNQQGWVTLGIAVGIALLRELTHSPVPNKAK